MLELKIRRLRVGMGYLLICSISSERQRREEGEEEGRRGTKRKDDFHFLCFFTVFLESLDLLLVIFHLLSRIYIISLNEAWSENLSESFAHFNPHFLLHDSHTKIHIFLQNPVFSLNFKKVCLIFSRRILPKIMRRIMDMWFNINVSKT